MWSAGYFGDCARMTSKPEIAGATSVRGLIGGKEAIDHEAEVAPAAFWLTERGDYHEKREQRLETVEWAILIFVILGVVADFALAFGWFNSK